MGMGAWRNLVEVSIRGHEGANIHALGYGMEELSGVSETESIKI